MAVWLVEQFYKTLKLLNSKQLDSSIPLPEFHGIYLFPKQLKNEQTTTKVPPNTVRGKLLENPVGFPTAGRTRGKS